MEIRVWSLNEHNELSGIMKYTFRAAGNKMHAYVVACKNGKYEHDSLYGDGSAGDKIAEILANLPDISAQKRIAY